MAQNYRPNYQNNGKRTMGSNGRDGLQDWKCQACFVLNRYFRVRCFGCDKHKSFSPNNFGDGGQRYKIKIERYDAGGDSNDWICKNYNCSFSNRHFRLVCLKCRRPKSNNHTTQNHNITGRNDESGGDNTDWICTNSSCECSNRHFRSVCFKCHWPNPDSDRKLRSVSKATVAEKSSTTKNEVGDGTMARFGLPSSFGGPRLKTEPVSGDLTSVKSESPNEFGSSNRDVGGNRLSNTTDKHWACPHCKFFLNDRLVSHCDNCNHSKPTLPSQEASENVKCIKVENDWTCDACGATNSSKSRNCSKCHSWLCFSCSSPVGYPNKSFRKTCYKCHTPKPLDFSPKHEDKLPVKREWLEKYEQDVDYQYFGQKCDTNDWWCIPCGNLANGHYRSTCYKCKEPRQKSEQSKQQGHRISRRKDWNCERCNFVNSYWKEQCHKCDESRIKVEENMADKIFPSTSSALPVFDSKIPPPPILDKRKIWLNNASQEKSTPSQERRQQLLVKSPNKNNSFQERTFQEDRPFVHKTVNINPELFSAVNSTSKRDSNIKTSKSDNNLQSDKVNSEFESGLSKPFTNTRRVYFSNSFSSVQDEMENILDHDSEYKLTEENYKRNAVMEWNDSLREPVVNDESKSKKGNVNSEGQTWQNCDSGVTSQQNQELRLIPHTSTPARRLPNNTSTPAHSDCSPFSIATISSPLLQTPIYPQSTTNAATSPTLRYNLRPLPANNDNYTKTSCANNELRGNRKRSHQYHKSTPKDSSDNDYPLPALQAAQKVDNKKQNFRQGDEGSWKGSSWNNNLGSMKNDFDQNRPKKRQWEQNNDKYVIDKADRGINRKYQKELYNRRNEHANARNQNEKKDNNEEYHNSSVEESIKETGYTNLYEYYKERKRKADEEKEKDVEAQRGVRDKLAALAGGYLTGEGKSTGKLNSKRPSSIRGKNISVEVIDIEDDAEGDEVIAIDTEGNCENIVREDQNQVKETQRRDEISAESNELKNILRSNMPDDEKANMLAKYGIRMKHSGRNIDHSTDRTRNSNEKPWLVATVAAADAATNSDNATQAVNNGGCDKKNEPEIIELD